MSSICIYCEEEYKDKETFKTHRCLEKKDILLIKESELKNGDIVTKFKMIELDKEFRNDLIKKIEQKHESDMISYWKEEYHLIYDEFLKMGNDCITLKKAYNTLEQRNALLKKSLWDALNKLAIREIESKNFEGDVDTLSVDLLNREVSKGDKSVKKNE